MNESVFLRDIVESDLPLLFEQQRDPEASAMAGVPARTREAFDEHWRATVLGIPSNRCQIVSTTTAQVAGHVVSWNDEDRRMIGYWLAREWWGQGIATHALRTFLHEQDSIRPLWAHVAVHNPASLRVLEKCGFTRVGGCERSPYGFDELLLVLRA
jgi:RimJ/RimL family protein N-acetyltransferase